MDNNTNNIERQRAPAEKEKIEKKQENSAELRERMESLGEGVSEVVEDVENGEKIEEKTGEDKRSGLQGKFPVTKSGKPQVQLKPLVFPKIELMQTQIARAIHEEIAVLEVEAKRVQDKPYELNGAIGKIRELRGILSSLTELTLEKLKNLWMKFVKKSS